MLCTATQDLLSIFCLFLLPPLCLCCRREAVQKALQSSLRLAFKLRKSVSAAAGFSPHLRSLLHGAFGDLVQSSLLENGHLQPVQGGKDEAMRCRRTKLQHRVSMQGASRSCRGR